MGDVEIFTTPHRKVKFGSGRRKILSTATAQRRNALTRTRRTREERREIHRNEGNLRSVGLDSNDLSFVEKRGEGKVAMTTMRVDSAVLHRQKRGGVR